MFTKCIVHNFTEAFSIIQLSVSYITIYCKLHVSKLLLKCHLTSFFYYVYFTLQTYSSTYRDEHSAPWTWMTRSQQELRFESGTAESVTSEELAEQGLETLNVSSPSRVLQVREACLKKV